MRLCDRTVIEWNKIWLMVLKEKAESFGHDRTYQEMVEWVKLCEAEEE